MTMTEKHKRTLYGYLFFAPFGILFLIFRIYPALQSAWITLHEWDVLGTPKFIGFANFTTVFHDPTFWSSLWHTVYFTLLTVPPLVLLGFLMAILVNSKIYFQGFFRAAFYIPYILSISVVCITWGLLYSISFGLFNAILKSLGLPIVQWLGIKWAMVSIGITTIWWTVGFNFIVYLAGLQQISPTYYEASVIDGASGFQNLIHITLPLLKRSHILVIVLQVLASLQIFGQVFIMTGGGPGGSTRVLVQYMYELGFRYFKMGLAQTIALLFFLLMLGVSYLQVRLMTRRGED
jgi:multiple sugar transport system permease protein